MIILGCLKSCFVTMGWSVLFTFNAEFFPTYIRSTGIAFGNASARLGGLISPIITGEMMEWSGGPVIVLLMLSMLYLLLSVLSTLFIGDKKKANIEVEIRDV